MRGGIWEILGIAQTSDQRAIKRAYATMLKQHKPEDDPAAFQRLRQAFEEARSLAEYLGDDEHPEQVLQPLAYSSVATSVPGGLSITHEAIVEPVLTDEVEGPGLHFSFKLEHGTLNLIQPDSSYDPPVQTAPHDAGQQLYEDAVEHARHIWERLQSEHMENAMGAWLASYLEQDWFVYMDARQFLEHALLNLAIEGDKPSIRSDVMRFAGNFFDWNPNSLHRRNEAWLIAHFWRRYEFSLAWETIHAINAENPMLQRVVKMLRQAPRPWLFRMEALFRPKQLVFLRQLFEHWDEHCPEIYHYLNDGTVGWWRQYALDENRVLLPLFDSTGTVFAFAALLLALFARENIQAEAIMLLPLWAMIFAALYGIRIAYGQCALMTLPYRQRFWHAWDMLLQHPAAVPVVIISSLVDIGLLASLPDGVPLIILSMLSYLLPYLFLRDFKEWFGLNLLALPTLLLIQFLQAYVANPFLLLHFGGICIIAGGWYGLSRLALDKHWDQDQLARRIKYWNYLVLGLPFILLFFLI